MSGSPTLRVEALCKSFGGLRALAEVGLILRSGEVTAIVGPNGAGKTTFLNVVTGCLRPDSGQVYLGEREITGLPPHRISRLGVGRTFQELRLIEDVPVLENVMLARQGQRGETLWAALVGLGVAREEESNRAAAIGFLRLAGLEGKARELAGELSYGQQKLLTLAVLLATGASCLLLDEPVSGVHPEIAARVLDFLLQLKSQGRAVVFIEHDLAAVRRVADRVVVMDEGRVIADGPPAEALEHPAVLEAFVG